MKQGELFGSRQSLPPGMICEPDFITPAEEAALLKEISNLPLREAKYKEYTAKRRIISYGASYDFSSNELIPAGPIPLFLHALRERVARWVGVLDSKFTHALVAEYKPGTQLGWHRDVPEFEIVVGISLAGTCRLRLRPYPPKKGKRGESLSLDLEPRSAYVLRGEARWGWQHSIPPAKSLRYSITFRTRRLRSNGMKNTKS
jgi:alkylated DNA repair dioxygenase AlkB